MKPPSRLTNIENPSPLRWILGALVLITLWIQTTVADPFNSPKLWVLMIFAAWLTGYIVSYRKIIFAIKPIRILSYLVLAFLISLLIATMFTDFRYVAIFGETQRRNGLLQYASLSIILVATSIFVRFFNVKKLFTVTHIIAIILSAYSLMQTTGNDFIKWNNPYNAVIGTLGNPNFAAAVMAIMGVIIFSSIFTKSSKYINRVLSILLSVLLLLVIYRSNARQGLLAYIIGVSVFLIIWLWTGNKKIGIAAVLIGFFAFVISVLGMLQVGPLEKYLYKPSISLRGHYWKAGIEMFKTHPFFGVGIDRYGAYFKEYRDVSYPLTYGNEITSTNAHNTFIQFFATGGVFLGCAYLILNAYILKRAIHGIRNLTGQNQLFLAGVFSAWVAFHSQSLISIDNIGVSIWGWILGGSIVGLSLLEPDLTIEKEVYFLSKKNVINLNQSITSGISTLPMLILIVLLYRGETNSYKSTESVNLQDQASRNYFIELQLKVINTPLNDPTYSLYAASRLIQSGFVNEGLVEVKKISVNDPRNLDALLMLALTYEQLNDLPNAIIYRENLAKLDPWNASNYLELGRDYKFNSNLLKSKEMLDKILSFAPTGIIAEQASQELTS
jgi:O-antigen ligase